ncbi:MAG: hypothetical protein JST83_10040 [Bacteroidetes bacterium]|nr:hypothetical protein [Bacteroidota bacterium]
MKNRLINGGIYSVPLRNEQGYGYLQFVDSLKLFPTSNLPGIALLFDCQSPNRLDLKLINRALLIAPIGLSSFTRAISKLKWDLVGVDSFTNSLYLPDVKTPWPPFLPSATKWAYYEELGNTDKLHMSQYENVKHLDFPRLLNAELISFRIYVELKRKMTGQLSSIDLTINNFLEEYEFDLIKDLPVYSSLPEELKGKAIR